MLCKKVLQGHGAIGFQLRPLESPITSTYFNLFFFFGISSSLPNLCVKTSTSDVCLIQSVRQPLHVLQLPTKGASWATADRTYGVYQLGKDRTRERMKKVQEGAYVQVYFRVPLHVSISQLFPGLMCQATLRTKVVRTLKHLG